MPMPDSLGVVFVVEQESDDDDALPPLAFGTLPLLFDLLFLAMMICWNNRKYYVVPVVSSNN